MNQNKTNRLKVGLVVVLAIVFVLVLGNSLRSINTSPPPPPRQSATQRTPTQRQATAAAPRPEASQTASAPSQNVRAAQEPRQATWPTFELADVIAFDPFGIAAAERSTKPNASGALATSGLPASGRLPENSTTKEADASAAITGKIQAVYQRGGRSAVMIDSRTMRLGDNIEGAGRIVEVDQGGVMLQVDK